MKSVIGIALLAGVLAGAGNCLLLAQTCQDDEDMTKSSLKDMADLVDAVKKESLGDFEKSYHQKTFLSKAGFGETVVTGLVNCLDKAAQDPAATKDQVDAYKAKRDAYAKLKDRIEQTKNVVKSAEQKDAKADIEKLDLST